MFLSTTLLTLLVISGSSAMSCTDVVCDSGELPKFWNCDGDDLPDAVCGYAGLGWVLALSTNDCQMGSEIVQDSRLLMDCRPVSVVGEVIDVQERVAALEDKLDIILHDLALRGPLEEDCKKGDPWCIHIVENGSTALDMKFRGSTILTYVHDEVKNWLFDELTAAGLFEDDLRHPYACYIGRENVKIANEFHRNCDDVGSFSVTLVQTNDGSIYGIVSTKQFGDQNVGETDDGLFLVSLFSASSNQPTGFRLNGKKKNRSILRNWTFGPQFTGLQIRDDCMSVSASPWGGEVYGEGTYWESQETEWQRSHGIFEPRFFTCNNLEVWIVAARS